MSKRKLDVQQQVFGFPDEDLKTSRHDEIVLWLKRNAREIASKLIGWTGTWDSELIESERQLAAATVAERVKLLQKSLTKDKSTLEAIDRDQSRFYTTQDLEKRIKAMEAEHAFLRSCHGLGEPPERKLDVRCELEHVLRNRYEANLRIVGFADVMLSVRELKLCAGKAPSDDYGRPYLGVDPTCYTNWSVTWRDFISFAFDAKSNIRSLGELIRQFKTYRVYCPKLPFYIVSPDSHFAKHIAEEGFGFIKYPDGIITFPKRSIYH